MKRKPQDVASAVRQATSQFRYTFGSELVPRFQSDVLAVLVNVYPNDPSKILNRASQIISTAEDMTYLDDYLRVSCVAEQDGLISYDDAVKLLGLPHVQWGETIYHFSNLRHAIGFRGHRGMCLADNLDFESQFDAPEELTGIKTSEPIIANYCRVRDPHLVLDHFAMLEYGSSIRLFAANLPSGSTRKERLLARDKEAYRIGMSADRLFCDIGYRWFELAAPGAIESMITSSFDHIFHHH